MSKDVRSKLDAQINGAGLNEFDYRRWNSTVIRVQEESGIKISKTWYRRTICHQTVAKHGLQVFIVAPNLR